MNSGLKRRATIDVDKTIAFIRDVHSRSPLGCVVFAGGEPTLLKNDLLRLIRACDEVGISTRLVTNASWAIDELRADRWVARLREAGLREINFSADDYHLPFVPFENIVRAWKAIKGQGFTSASVVLCSGEKSHVTPDFVDAQLGEALPRRFDDAGIGAALPDPSEDGTLYLMSNSTVQLLARARRSLSRDEQSFTGDLGPALGPCRFAMRSAAITPKNHLATCCGFEVQGNEVLDLGPIDSESDAGAKLRKAGDDVLVTALSRFGPHFLREVARKLAPEITFDESCRSMCEICEDTVTRPEVVQVLHRYADAIAATILRMDEECM